MNRYILYSNVKTFLFLYLIVQQQGAVCERKNPLQKTIGRNSANYSRRLSAAFLFTFFVLALPFCRFLNEFIMEMIISIEKKNE